MDKRIVQQVISETLDAVNDQVNTITDYNGKIPWIEIDITKDYLRTLYENILVLERYNGNEEEFVTNEAVRNTSDSSKTEKAEKKTDVPVFQPIEDAPEPESAEETVTEEPPMAKPVVEEIVEDTPEPLAEELAEETLQEVEKKSAAIKEPPKEVEEVNTPMEKAPRKTQEKIPTIEDLLFSSDEAASAEDKKPEHQEVKEQKKVTKSGDSNSDTIADRLGTTTKSLGETIHTQDRTLADNIDKEPIRKLKAAIGINDKFIFLNDLFYRVLEDYTYTITALDEAKNIEEAAAIIKARSQALNWDENSEAFKKLKNLVDRKFINY